MKKYLAALICLLLSLPVFSQGVLKGKIINPVNNQPVAFANVLILNTELGAISDENGNYQIGNIPPVCFNTGGILPNPFISYY